MKRKIQLNDRTRPLTYISLFSSAGVGCYGFKQAGFECIATSELLEKRLNIQRINNKCKHPSGYIPGNIELLDTRNSIYSEVQFWRETYGISEPDVLIATPPCQGMSVANHKKSKNEIKRNSLVVQSIFFVKNIKPKVFIFENVPSFLRTACIVDDDVMSISDAIYTHLSSEYFIDSKVINFKNYGANSSRNRTLVIGTLKRNADFMIPADFFPSFSTEKPLVDVIGHLSELNSMGEISDVDPLHSFRKYDIRMRSWISDLNQGESAFDNFNPVNRPHQIIDGEMVPNIKANSDKYTRQSWRKVAPCIHTRNDQLASQNTIHPVDDRVFSIRELMLLMSIPKEFKWFEEELENISSLNYDDKFKFLKYYDIIIRQSIGEAVPTAVFFDVAQRIKKSLNGIVLNSKEVIKLISENNLTNHKNLIEFLEGFKHKYNLSTITKILEFSNSLREKNAAYYTDKALLFYLNELLPNFNDKDHIRILEPAVGVGAFLPIISNKYKNIRKVVIDCVDISPESIEILAIMIKIYNINKNVEINLYVDDYLNFKMNSDYDLVVGNPPFGKLLSKQEIINSQFINLKSNNLSSYFIEKSLNYSDNVLMIMPKSFLNSSEYKETRNYIGQYKINSIIDFGEKGFKGVLIETICLSISKRGKIKNTLIYSLPLGIELDQNQNYITSTAFPYWVIYRNKLFDDFAEKLDLNVFTVFRDRQITNSFLKTKTNNLVRVIKSRNISDDSKIVNIPFYDAYIDRELINKLAVRRFIDDDNVYLTPNMTYKTRLIRKPKNTVVNGSVAILIPHFKYELSKKEIDFFSSIEYRNFMQIARNYQTRTLNVDRSSVYFYGIPKRKI